MNNKKEYMAIDHEGLHDYNIVIEDIENKGTKYSIFRSQGAQYQTHAKGELVISMTDTGDDIEFSKSIKTLDYTEALCLRVLLTLEHETSIVGITPLKYRIVENKQILEL